MTAFAEAVVYHFLSYPQVKSLVSKNGKYPL